ncbi:MAG TPA: AraC family transcriptional regulator, partial [Lachnospiraceae bacterium]|nr:AraC family transcriptional regulator [Lachnospiraceae bacterium]
MEHELIIPNEGFPFKLFQFEGKDGNYVRGKHWHRSIEIFAVFEGRLTFYVNEEKRFLQRGEFILLNSNEVHSILSPEPNKTIVLQIPLKLFENYYIGGNQFLLFTHQKREQDAEIMKLLKEMYDGVCQKEIGYEWNVQSGFFKLLYLLINFYRRQEIPKDLVRNHKKLDKLSMITSYIRDNYTKELSLEMLAEVFGYSPSYLSRMFQKYAKTNYKTYLQSVRLEYA